MVEAAVKLADLIPPGMFSFCPRCGSPESCQVGDGAKTCLVCLIWTNRLDSRIPEDAARIRALGDPDEFSIAHFNARQGVALNLIRHGMKPKWWCSRPGRR